MSSYIQLNGNIRYAKDVLRQRSQSVNKYPVLSRDDVKLSENGLSAAQQKNAWEKMNNYLGSYQSTFAGVQADQSLRCSDVLKKCLQFYINNDGDPFSKVWSADAMHTKVMECAVLDYFAKLWNIKLPDFTKDGDRDEAYWGYVVSMGCTEANLAALYNARGYLSGKQLLRSETESNNSAWHQSNGFHKDHAEMTTQNAFTPVAFYSYESYHGFNKAMQILQISTFHDLGSGYFSCPLSYPDDYPSIFSEEFLDEHGWPNRVPVDETGAMYLPALVKLVDAFASKGYPPIVIFTSGTTFKGCYENPEAAIRELVPILKKHNLYERRVYYSSKNPTAFDTRHGFWFHVDGALGAAHLPFLEKAIKEGSVDNVFKNGFPVFDFRIPEIMSISMSLHKWLGCIFPSGIFMTRKKNQVKPMTNPLYVGGGDCTISGSRNGHGVMILWDLLSKNSHQDFTERATRGEQMVQFSLKKFQELEKHLGEDLLVSRSPGSLFVCFKQPREDIAQKYSLSRHSFLVKTKQGARERRHYSHICLMPHVDEELIENLIDELKEPGAFPSKNAKRGRLFSD